MGLGRGGDVRGSDLNLLFKMSIGHKGGDVENAVV